MNSRRRIRHLPSRYDGSLSWVGLKGNWVAHWVADWVADLPGPTGKGRRRQRRLMVRAMVALPALSEVLPAIERAGLLITDIEIPRLRYAETLRGDDRLRASDGDHRAPLRLAGESSGAILSVRPPRGPRLAAAPLVPVTVKARRGPVEKNKNLPW
jgi:hypothetical protein